MTYRNTCVICEYNLLKITELKNHVISYSPTVLPSINSTNVSLPVGFCSKCYSIQFMKLIPPHILYKDSHNETFNTPTWKEHHNNFYTFFKDILLNINTCIEIGGAQCILASRIIKDYPLLKYNILDIIDQPLSDIDVQIGNCEEYSFSQDCVILSHVFEHLHNPKLFLNNIKDSPVNYIILSVPNLEYLLEQDNLNLIHIEHTFYYNKSHLNYVFNQISFTCIKHEEFKNHSLFYIFKRVSRIDIKPTFTYSDTLVNYYSNREMKLNSISLNIDSDIWIAPAGHYGHTIYSFLVNKGYSEKIKAFIDNDTSKHGKYLNGTDIQIMPYSKLIGKLNITVILYAGIYTKEISSQILQLNTNIHIVYI